MIFSGGLLYDILYEKERNENLCDIDIFIYSKNSL